MRIRLFLQVSAIALATTFLFGCNMLGSSGSGSSASTTFALSGISPSSGGTAGGTAVTISGNNLQSGDTVTFGDQPATSVKAASSNQIVAVTPAHTAGWVDVAVSDPSGESATLAAAFGYGSASPAVSTVSPNSGPITGDTTVKISGSNFAAGALVFFGAVAATGVTVNSPTQIQAITPSVSAAGAVSVMVKNPDGQSGSLANAFTYSSSPSSSAPTVSAVSPSATTAGTDVQVDGSNFASGATVTVGSAAASNVQFMNSGELTATVPNLSPGSYDVTVANTNGLSATLSSGLTVSPPQGLLSGCTVGSNNQPSCSIPSGWTLAVADGFDSGSLASSAEKLYGSSIECSVAHTGSCADGGNYSGGDQQIEWILKGSAVNSREVYLSWWEYDATPGKINMDMYMFRRILYDSSGGFLTDVIWDGEVNPSINGNCNFNCLTGSIQAYAEGSSGNPNWGKWSNALWNPLFGQWVQYEVDVKLNDPGLSNGYMSIYQNGQLIQSWSNLNQVGSNDGSTGDVVIGGVYTYLVWYLDSGKTQCSSTVTGAATSNYSDWTQPDPCPVQAPPNGYGFPFHRYFDDVIVLKR